jgi:hypothetical protein
MLNDEDDLRQQLDVIANQSQTVTLIHGRLQQFEIEMSGFRTDIVECRAIIQRQAELITVQRAMIHELLTSAGIQ